MGFLSGIWFPIQANEDFPGAERALSPFFHASTLHQILFLCQDWTHYILQFVYEPWWIIFRRWLPCNSYLVAQYLLWVFLPFSWLWHHNQRRIWMLHSLVNQKKLVVHSYIQKWLLWTVDLRCYFIEIWEAGMKCNDTSILFYYKKLICNFK